MTFDIDSLLQDIHDEEALSFTETLSFEQQSQIESMILSSIHQERPLPPAQGARQKLRPQIKKQPATPRAGQKLRPRKFLSLVLAAALLMGFGVVASAARSNDWDIALMEFMGIDNADTLQWSDGTVQIQASSVCSGTDYAQDSSGKIHPLKITATSPSEIKMPPISAWIPTIFFRRISIPNTTISCLGIQQ